MFRKMPFILLAVIITVMLLNSFIPYELKRILYSISLSIKEIITVILPFIIFGLLFKAAVRLSNNATKIIGILLLFIICSNFTSTFLSHYVGSWIYHFDLAMLSPKDSQEGITPLWSLGLPKLLANDKAMFAGLILGIVAAKLNFTFADRISTQIENIVTKVLRGFVYFIPLFVAGFVIKLNHDGVMHIIIKDYTIIFVCIALTLFSYITFLYLALNKGNAKGFIFNFKNMLPAAISGFSTMSSAASMPLTLIGAENNAKNKDLARSVIPATVNIHLIGDCISIPIFAYAVLKSFGIAEPTLLTYLTFTFYFVIAKFSVAAVPGGGILVMLPILETYLGFNTEMLTLITALYILFDPVITSANVLGNGAFAKMVDNWNSYFSKDKKQSGLTA